MVSAMYSMRFDVFSTCPGLSLLSDLSAQRHRALARRESPLDPEASLCLGTKRRSKRGIIAVIITSHDDIAIDIAP